MDHITLQQIESDGILLDLTALLEFLAKVEDKRAKRGKQFPLAYLLTWIIMAKLAGQNKPSSIAQWLRLRCKILVRLFQFERGKVPSLNTIRRTLQDSCNLTDLQSVLLRFLHQSYGGQQSMLIAIDGKTLRGTIPKGRTQGVHLLAAYLPDEGIVLCQVTVGSKENEIVAAPTVLEAIDLRGRVVCGDAMFTQRSISVAILSGGGDYIWFAKGNQSTLQDDIERFFEPLPQRPGWHQPKMEQEIEHTSRKAHQRLEKRTLTVIDDKTGYLDWPGVERVFKIERQATCLTTGKLRSESVVGITSLTSKQVSTKQLMSLIQNYWGIENGLHYRRDVTLDEDATRISSPLMAEGMATLNNFIIGLASKLGLKNLAFAQRLFDASISEALAPFY